MNNASAESDAGFPWLASTMLAFEACEVIQLRLAKLATGGDDADDEAQLMVHEKVDDLHSDPAGNSGGRIGCGVIQR